MNKPNVIWRWCGHIHKDHLIGWQLQFVDKDYWHTGDANHWNFCPICSKPRPIERVE